MLDTDQEKGRALLISGTIIFLYYTLWVICLPFADDNRLKSLFLSYSIALMVPAISGLCFVGGLIIFAFYHIKPYLVNKDKKNE